MENKCQKRVIWNIPSAQFFAFLIAPIIFAIISYKNITVATISQNYRLDIFPFNKRCS